MGDIKYPELKQVCLASFNNFCDQFDGHVFVNSQVDKKHVSKIPLNQLPLDSGDFYIYLDRGSDVLGVCHLDTAGVALHYDEANLNGHCVFSPALDDRLGVFGLLNILPDLVFYPYDVLLTTGEESGLSSASIFKTDKVYNWVFELDRRGLDVVTYRIDSKHWRSALGKAGMSIGRGSFSDICALSMSCCMVNVGIGYHEEHTRMCHVFMDDFFKAIKRFSRFYNDNYHRKFVADSITTYPAYSYDSYFSGRFLGHNKKDDSDVLFKCENCGHTLVLDAEVDAGLCSDCLNLVECSDIWHSTKYSCFGCSTDFALEDLVSWEGELFCRDCLCLMNGRPVTDEEDLLNE